MSSGKRNRSVFQSLEELEEEDAIALTKRKVSTKREKQNSLASISQQKINTKLLEVRILLQRVLQALDETKNQQEEKDEELTQCNALMAKLLHARHALQGPSTNDGDHDDDNDDDGSSNKYRDLMDDDEALEKTLQEEYENCEKEWQKVFNQRNKDVRLHSGLTSKSQYRVLDSTFWEQVNQTVLHEKFLENKNKGDDDDDDNVGKFDDSKVYQQLLKDFLSMAAPDNKSLQQQQQQQQQSSTERLRGSRRTVNPQVDRRASKGRKIRYTPIAKLVNFTFPLSRPSHSAMLEEDAFFRSLFGGVGTV